MSISNPVFGIDVHPEYQKSFDFDRAKAQGYEYAFIKASEGPYRDETTYVPTAFKDFHARAKASGMIVGLHHVLLESDGDDPQRGGRIQADLFYHTIQSVGGTQGKLIAVVFEAYSHKYPWLWPTNETLKAFVSSLRMRIGNHPIVLYSVRSYWNETGTPSGDFDQYGADVAWDARYADMQPQDRPREHYHELQDWGWDKPWGGVTPMFWQVTPSGLVSGQYINVHVYPLTFKDLLSLAVTPLPYPDELEEEEGNGPPSPGIGMMENVQIAKQYGLKLLGYRPKYWCWDCKDLNIPRPTVGRPACVDGPPPKMENIKRIFCADLITLQLRCLGKPVPKNNGSYGNFDGGTRSFQLQYGRQMKPFNLSECREGDVAFVDFQTSWAPEGHIGFCLGNGPEATFLQSHLETYCPTGEPGLNHDYTLRQSNTRPGGGNYYTHRIPREVIWG